MTPKAIHLPCCAPLDPPAEILSLTRAGPDHFGVRFGHTATHRVWLDGEDVTNRAVECLIGPQGWVELLQLDGDGRPVVHWDDHVATRVHRGRVLVTWVQGRS